MRRFLLPGGQTSRCRQNSGIQQVRADPGSPLRDEVALNVSLARLAARKLKTWAERLASVTGWFGGCAVVLVFVGVLAVCTEVLSPSFLLWTGHAVPGLDLGGTVNYQYHGISYTFEAHDRSQYAPPETVTVYLDPSDPILAVEDKLSTRLFDATFVLTPFLAAAASVALGWLRRRRSLRRAAAQLDRDGYGFRPGELGGHR